MTTVLVTFILVMVLVSGRFIKYLAEAAAGEIAADALFLVMAFRLPEFLQMILPLSLSYDHRVIDGAAAARFTTYLSQLLTDMRQALL